jgi:predicted RNA-binding protein YlqC (UPF0109 family)
MPTETASEAQRVLTELVRALVDHPDAVRVEEEDLGHTILLKVHADPDDLGKVIGRQGRTVWALRSLLEVRTVEGDAYYDVEIVEP